MEELLNDIGSFEFRALLNTKGGDVNQRFAGVFIQNYNNKCEGGLDCCRHVYNMEANSVDQGLHIATFRRSLIGWFE